MNPYFTSAHKKVEALQEAKDLATPIMIRNTFVIIENNFLLRKGLTLLINGLDNAVLLGESDGSAGFIHLVNTHRPDFVIVNPSVFNKWQVSNIRSCFSEKLETHFIAFVHDNTNSIYLSQFEQTLYSNENGEQLLRKILSLCSDHVHHDADTTENFELTERERDVVKCLALGRSHKEIADELCISAHTVNTHRKNISRKLGIKSAAGITVYAIINKLVDMSEMQEVL